MSGVLAAIAKAEAQRTSRAASVEKGARLILSKWGGTIDAYRSYIPASVVAVRSQVESSGKPSAGPTSQGERGLLMLWPSTQQKYGVTDATNPQQNLRAGILHWLTELGRMQSKLPGLLTSHNTDFWAITQLYTAIGGGATPYLLKVAGVRPGREYRDLVAWLKRTGEGLEAHRSRFGSQSAASVARRIIVAGNMTSWASSIGGLGGLGLGVGMIVAAAGIAYLVLRGRS